jgi:conjugal transfer mating pair stabilization protein TraG
MGDFNKNFDGQEEANTIGLLNQSAMTELRRDPIDDASVNYLNEQRGMSTLLLNSLAGGLGYEEPRLGKEVK